MIALFEETRDLRMMSGWQPGMNPELDQAVTTVPRIYKALGQSRASEPGYDPFTELAEYLKNDQAGTE
jgi:flagellum-specific ATP synthase